MISPKQVCVIGAGVSGLAAAKAFAAHGHKGTIIEKSGDLGGVWDPGVAGRLRGCVRPGDTVYAESEILETRHSRSRPTQGIVTFEHRGFNQHNEEIAYCRRIGLMMRRPA